MARVRLGADDDELTIDRGDTQQPHTVLVDELQPNPENPRPNKLEVDDMVKRLREKGQLQNINVVSLRRFLEVKPYLADQLNDKPYVVINGRRRMEAAVQAGLTKLKSEQHDEWDASQIDQAVIDENEDREAVNPLHLGRFLRRMAAGFPSQRKLAAHLGRSPAWVSQRVAMTDLHEELQAAIEAGKVPFVLARECARLADELQPRLASGELPVDVAQAWIVTLRIKPEEQLERFRSGPPFDTQPTPATRDEAIDGKDADATDHGDGDGDPDGEPEGTRKPRPIVIRITERSPGALADALRKQFSAEEIGELVAALTAGE